MFPRVSVDPLVTCSANSCSFLFCSDGVTAVLYWQPHLMCTWSSQCGCVWYLGHRFLSATHRYSVLGETNCCKDTAFLNLIFVSDSLFFSSITKKILMIESVKWGSVHEKYGTRNRTIYYWFVASSMKWVYRYCNEVTGIIRIQVTRLN
jgi:hypothetical protein